MVIWTSPAKADLRDIYDHIAKDSKFYAKKVAQEIREKVEQADKFAHLGKVVPEIANETIREFHIYSYRIIYEIKSDGNKHVLTVIHQRQNFKPDIL